MNSKELVEFYQSIDINSNTFVNCFRSIAGTELSELGDFDNTIGKLGIKLTGQNVEKTIELYMNVMIIILHEKDDIVFLSNGRAAVVGEHLWKLLTNVCSKEEMIDYAIKELTTLLDQQSEIIEDEDEEGWGSEEDFEEIVEEKKDDLRNEEEVEDVKEIVEEVGKEEPQPIETNKEVKDSIKAYYFQFYKGVVDELCKRYTELFSSGYEVTHPAGILTNQGLIGLSGNKMVVKKFNVSIKTMYSILNKNIDFDVEEVRSNINIADSIYDSYMSGRRLKYFPYKLLEYAYGRKAPSGDNQESVNTYESHSSAGNWGAFCKSEVFTSLMSVVGGSVVKFVYLNSKEDYYSEEAIEEVKGFLAYLQECLSLCLLMVDYKSTTKGYEEDIASFKIRVCDPKDAIIRRNLTETFITDAFMGSTGSVPFSYMPRIVDGVHVVEYAHEFNHNSSQASPLFAYKAFQALKEQGVAPTWDNMILGMFEDGSILKNGSRGVSMRSRLTHHIPAGSRAGKGLLTMNIIASAIYSYRNIFYLDRKPDMASLFKYLASKMFVVNGGGYGGQYDTYNQFSNLDSMLNTNNIPSYVNELLEGNADWSTYGDIIYMRALKLIMGIIVARGDGKLNDPNFGGENGILLVADEFKNFQESFSVIVEKLLSKIPPSTFTIDSGKIENGEKLKPYERAKLVKDFSISYNNSSMYAISYLNSLVADSEFLSTKRDAGFNQMEIELSDIFVIGQNLNFGSMDFKLFRSLIDDSSSSGRYKSAGRNGISSTAFSMLSKLGVQSASFPYSMVTFKTNDAFFGRNMEEGRDVYLAQTVKASKAYGRLDDKASNFAYMNTFTDKIREDIVGGNVQINTQLANECIYFKPFLVLNDAKEGDLYTEGLFSRCKGTEPGKVWVSKEDLIAENPNEDGTFINDAAGFEGYLKMMGVTDYSERLNKSSDIANYVVNTCLGYDGTWFDFITDMRPEWLFTIKDIVDGSKGIKPALSNPAENKVLSEFVRFNQAIFGLENTESDGGFGITDSESVSSYMNPNSEVNHDYSDAETQDCIVDEDMKEVFGDYDNEETEPTEDSDEIDIFSTPTVAKPISSEDLFKNSGAKRFEIDDLLQRLKNLGVDTSNISGFGADSEEDISYIRMSDITDDMNLSIDSLQDEDESYERLSARITEDIARKFGGFDNIKSLKVIGGSLVINGHYYNVKIDPTAIRGLPYDVRKELFAGNVSKAFNYSSLLNMRYLRELEFDSVSFVYDYVSRSLHHGKEISVDLMFKDLRSLQVIKIGRYMFNRQDYMKQLMNNDVFYHPTLRTRFLDASENILGDFSKSSWSFTKSMFNSREHGKLAKTLGVVGGVTGTVVSGSTSGALKGGRFILKELGKLTSSVKEMIDDSKKF